MRNLPTRLWLLAAGSAIFQILPFPIAGPAPLWRRLFCWFCLAPLLVAMLGKDRDGNALRPGQTALLGYLCGVIWYLGNCYWIYQTMHIYGDLPKIAAYGILLLFALYVALYHALFGYGVGRLRRRFSRQTVLLIAPFLWVAVELARARVTGFPWDLLGYTQVDNLALSRLAPLTGVMGLSFVVAAVNSVWLVKLQRLQQKPWAGPVAAVLLSAVFSLAGLHFWSAENTDVTASAVLLQENLKIGAEATGPPESRDQLLSTFSGLSMQPDLTALTLDGKPAVPPEMLAQKPRIIVWPEAPAPFFDADTAFRQGVGALAIKAKTPVIVDDITNAFKTPEGHNKLYNSAAFFHADGSYAGRYDKMHLVPFGEYTPYQPLFFFAGQLLGDLPFVPGLERKIFTADGKRYGVFICYESIFGDDIRRFAGDGAQVLVNISDDGWYGDSSAPWEHLDMVRMRAIENHRWIVRATNTGVTVAIDPFGRITATMPRHIRASMVAGFAYRDGLTLYTRFGDWFAWLCALVTLACLLAHFRKPRNVQ